MDNNTRNKSSSLCLLGALAGDMIGAPFEFERQKSTDFPLFSVYSTLTDDSILTLAVADAILNSRSYLECKVINVFARTPTWDPSGTGFFFIDSDKDRLFAARAPEFTPSLVTDQLILYGESSFVFVDP